MFGKKNPPKEGNNNASTEQIIEALLFYFAKEISFKELSRMSGATVSEVRDALTSLQQAYLKRGVTLLIHKNTALLTTSPDVSDILDGLIKQEDQKPLSKSALETLSIVAYNGPVSRPEIDYIRGVNSSYALRNLSVRGLIDKTKDGSQVLYSPSIDTMRFMGISNQQELPDYSVVTAKVSDLLEQKESEEATEDIPVAPEENKETQNDTTEA